jgi:general secretion pathway protein B
MSFILDALKKAESERNRRVAPVLMDARIAPPRRRLPGWVWALGAVLLVNLGLLAWLLLRTPPQQTGGADAAGVTSTALPVADDVDPDQPAPAVVAPVTPAPPPTQSAQMPAPGAAAPPIAPQLPAGAAGVRAATPSDEESLPTLAELQAAGVALPALQLDLHIYDLAPAGRSVLLNGQRLREGEYTPNGVKLERVTAQGVVLEAGGRRFRLSTGD